MLPIDELLEAPSLFLDEIEFQILNEEDIHALCALCDAQSDRASMFNKMRTEAIQRHADDDIVYALSDMYEALEVRCMQLADLAQRCIRTLEDELSMDEQYGTCQEQVRDTYYGGQL